MASQSSTPPVFEYSGINTPADVEVHPTAARADVPIVVESARTVYTDEYITSTFDYHGQTVTKDGGVLRVKPTKKVFEFRTERKVPKTGSVIFVSIYIQYTNSNICFDSQFDDGRSRW
jgi:myo-inositol-1-phosphate synthase